MRVIRGLPSDAARCDCAAAIGNFDGVHRGHQALLAEVCAAARARSLVPAVITFEPHPKEYFRGAAAHLTRISTLRDKLSAILACGIERVYVLPFNDAMASLSPAEFARDILSEGLSCRWVTVGENFAFGAGNCGTAETLSELGRHYHFETYVTPMLFHGLERVSSSRIRAALALGNFAEAADMLGRPLAMTGRVVHGAALGRKLGYPTLNLFALPPGCPSEPALRGVFAVRISGLDDLGGRYAGVASLGCKPTVTDDKRWLLEANVFNWKGDAYGRLLKVEFVEKLRDEQKFPSLEALTTQIHRDADRARAIFGLPSAGGR